MRNISLVESAKTQYMSCSVRVTVNMASTNLTGIFGQSSAAQPVPTTTIAQICSGPQAMPTLIEIIRKQQKKKAEKDKEKKEMDEKEKAKAKARREKAKVEKKAQKNAEMRKWRAGRHSRRADRME